jgi:hypothetical protein
VLSQLRYEAYFARLFQVAEFCEKKEGVSADRVHIIEATDDGTWGWGGPRKAPKLAEGEEVTEAYLAAKMPLMMGGEVAVFQAEGGVEFKGGKNKLGKILTEAMRATVAHKGDHTALVAGALLAFTLSLDDFVITFFTSGPDTITFPVKVYSMVRFSVTPEVNAASTILILLTVILTFIALKLQGVKGIAETH